MSLRCLCVFCDIVANTSVASVVDFKVICGLGNAPDCKKVYTKYNSFYKHIRRKHDDVYRGHTKPLDGDYFIVPNDEIKDEHHCASLPRAEEESCLSENEHVSSVGEMVGVMRSS